MPSSRLNKWIWNVFLMALYLVMGKLGLKFAQLSPNASLIWPATGLSLAGFILFGTWIWPGIFLGAFLVNLTTAGSILTSIGIAAGNTLEGIVGGFLIRKFAGGGRVFD